MKSFQLSWRGILTLILVSSLFAAAAMEYVTLLRSAAAWWVVSDSVNKPADAIVVLGGNFETRPDATVDLYKRGLGQRVLAANPEIDKVEISPTLQDLTFRKLHKLGVPTASLVKLPDGDSNTYQEARSVLLWARTNGAKDIIVPTDLFHTRCIYWVFTKELRAAGIGVKVRAINQVNYTVDDWWKNKEGRAAFLCEILKYVFYRVIY